MRRPRRPLPICLYIFCFVLMLAVLACLSGNENGGAVTAPGSPAPPAAPAASPGAAPSQANSPPPLSPSPSSSFSASSSPSSSFSASTPPGPLRIDDPYRKVDWQSWGHHKASLHAHTTASDGSHPPAMVIDAYREGGYTVLALTDHNAVTWPWNLYNRDPEALGMVAVQGNEISNAHHLGSYFCDYNGGSADVRVLLAGIGSRGGLAVLFHPGRYRYGVEWYAELYREFRHLVGLEVINMGGRYPDDPSTWDLILTKLMPERPVWGFANDDLHALPNIALCWNVLLLPELSEAAVRESMEQGRFYFCRGSDPPSLHSITADPQAGTITVRGAGYSEVVWICAGKEVHRGQTLLLRHHPHLEGYVRAELRGPGGVTYTNPFGLPRAH